MEIKDQINQLSNQSQLKLPIRCGHNEIVATIDLSERAEDAADVKNESIGESSQSDSFNAPLRTVGELRKFIVDEGGYDPSSKLRIVFRGKYIGEAPEEPLTKYQFKRTDKLMVIGGKSATIYQDDAGFKALLSYEKKHLAELNNQFKKNNEDLSELERNFLEGQILQEMLTRMDRRLDVFADNAMKHIEAIDGIPIITEATPAEHCQRNREKRKTMVVEIQQLLSQNDKFSFRLSQYKAKVENPESN